MKISKINVKEFRAMKCHLKLGLINIRSLRNKLEFLNETMKEFSIDILFVTETWAHDSETQIIQNALPKNYSIKHAPRSDNPNITGGGVAIIYNNLFTKIKELTQFRSKESFEILAYSFYSTNVYLNAAVIYRPGHPGSDVQFLEDFSEFLDAFTELGNFVICGDFNYWLDNPAGKPYTKNFIDIIKSHNCTNSVTKPTHSAGHILDLLIHDKDNTTTSDVVVHPINSSFSDHSLITFQYKFPIKKQSTVKDINFRNYKNIDLQKLNQNVSEITSILNPTLPTNELVHFYNSSLKSLHDKHFPLISKTIRIKESNPWYDTSISNLRKERRKAERHWRNTHSTNSRHIYMNARTKVVKHIEQKKKEYYKTNIKNCKSNQAKLWNLINKLIGNPDRATPKNVTADDINNFFIDKIKTIRTELDATPHSLNYSNIVLDYNTENNNIEVITQFRCLTEAEVSKIVNSVNKTYCISDPFNYTKVPKIISSLIPIITNIINSCFTSGTFPNSEKMAIVTPLLKKPSLDVEDLKNLRPVSNVTFLSKCIEKAILDQLLPHLNRNESISNFQSAYRQNHSTETTLCRIYNDLLHNIQNSLPSILILLDLSAAFDTIDHNLLMDDLCKAGIQSDALLLLRSYIEGREQKVLINSTLSLSREVSFGVPQGSVLGPILFSLYSSKLSKIMAAHDIDHHMYADDTQVYLPLTDISASQEKINTLLSDIKLWMSQRKLKLNPGKTEVILINGNLNSDVATQAKNINFVDDTVTCTKVRDLGLFFDTKLNFEDHFNYIIQTCNYQLRKLSSIMKFLDIETANMLIHAFITSRLDYCNSLFVNLPQKNLKKLQTILNRAARLIFNLPPFTSTSSYLYDLHWLPIKARIEFKICLLVHKALKHKQPTYLYSLLTNYSSRTNMILRAADDPHLLTVPRLQNHSSFGSRSFAYIGPHLYNKLPHYVKNTSNTNTFKKFLKTHLFNKSYDHAAKNISIDYRL